MPGGATVYAVPEFAPERVAPLDHLRRVMGEWVAEVTNSGNLVVVRTPPGCAHVVASALDRSGLEGLLGTVAGDDTMLCVATETAGGTRLADTLRELAGIETQRRDRVMADASDAAAPSGATLWHGRFEGGPDAALMAYTVSLPFDRRLWRDDIAGSRATYADWSGHDCSPITRPTRCSPPSITSSARSVTARSCSSIPTRTSTPPSSGG